MLHSTVAQLCVVAMSGALGCGAKDAAVVTQARPVPDKRVATSQPASTTLATPASMREIAADRQGASLLAKSVEAARRVRSARMEFHRQERLGLFKSLRDAERMTALCRESPFSVLFTWQDDDSELIQALYVEGENDGAVMLHQRRGILGGEGGVIGLPPDLAVVFQKAKLPITQFGPRRVMSALQARVDAGESLGGVDIANRGRAVVGPADELCDHLTVHFPEADAHAAKRVELYLHVETHLPVMIELWLPRRDANEEPRLDARYIFARMEINPPLSAADFRLATQVESSAETASE